MNQWAFVIAAYGLTLIATSGLVIRSWASMRRAEAEAEAARARS
jgi:heme exporter protein D